MYIPIFFSHKYGKFLSQTYIYSKEHSMEKRAKEFLDLSGRLYEENKSKWKKMIGSFDEDVYNDTILKVYEAILKGEDTEGDMVGYWYRSFKNNMVRQKGYKDNQAKKEIDDRLKEKEDIERQTNLYYSTVKDILLMVRNRFDRKTFELFRMYLLCNMSYEQLDSITGLDSKERIMKVRKWLNGNKNLR